MKKYFFNFLFLMMIFSFVIFSCANTTVAWENDDEDSSATIIEKSELFVSTITSSSLIETVFETNSTEYNSSTGYSLWSL